MTLFFYKKNDMKTELSEQENLRREKLETLKKLNINPFPAPSIEINTNAKDIKLNFEKSPDNFKNVKISGRIMSLRDMGKAAFAQLQDSTDRIQIYIKRDDFKQGEDFTQFDTIWKKIIDLGDIIAVEGFVFITQKGEISVHAKSFSILTKALKPLPVVKTDAEGNEFDEVTDPEFRYRQRYVDLIINPKVKKTFEKRSHIINAIRQFLNTNGALEVDTPVLQTIPGGAIARPFETHHNALNIPLYLRISNELYLKRLIVGGFDWVYEFSRNFRNEGMDRTHNPEFTILEFYVAYKDYIWMMQTTETLLEQVCKSVNQTTDIVVGDKTISFAAPFQRITIYDAIKKYANIDVASMDDDMLRKACIDNKIEVNPKMGRGKLIDAIFGDKCEKHFIQPIFITDYPKEMSPLSKTHRDNDILVERFELIINGKEIANAYSELNDPIDQLNRFEEQSKLKDNGDVEAMFVDYDFVRALEYGMPPTAGIGFGIDRLCMLLCNQHSIQDVLLFPTMKPEQH